MQSSQPNGRPSALRCPHCGAPLEAAPAALTTRCAYCGHHIKLAEPSAPAPMYPPAPPTSGASSRTLLVVAVVIAVALGLAAALLVYVGGLRSTAEARPKLRTALRSVKPVAPSPAPPSPAAPAAARSSEVRYPLRSLLGISTMVDIDGSRQHLLGLFPTIEASRVADHLRYVVPLSHPWFSVAALSWQNEKAGKLVSVGFEPPVGDTKLENQKEIADCLSRGLGKPEVRELDHLSGELSYFWGRHFPRAWLDVYSGYLWLAFEDPKGVAPITFAQVVRTLDGCAPSTH